MISRIWHMNLSFNFSVGETRCVDVDINSDSFLVCKLSGQCLPVIHYLRSNSHFIHWNNNIDYFDHCQFIQAGPS